MSFEQAYIAGGKVSPANIKFYKESGYLVAEQLLSSDEIDELKIETVEIFKGNRGHVDGMVDPENLTNDEILKKYVAIHFPHKISEVIKTYLNHEKVVDILTKIVSPNVKCMQSMLFVKAPGKAGQAWHQDEYYIPTRDKSLIGVWIAIDNATIENGCLWIVPGSNKPGYIMKRVPNSSKEYADVDTVDVSGFTKENIIPVEVKSGSVVFFNGYTLHSSLKNKTTDCFRTALVNHYMTAESMLPWDQDGKFEPTEDLRDIMMVSGEDPYAYKGVLDKNKPYLRPETLKIKTTE
ncbi:Ectoine hydroxylase-related dioxygenase, phytanoyl-CoA dioxygenase (PhyH) family [Pedobacter steynii]|uniref:Ectoine hydroxylase-related dioxygenase, phytanoyl-CoA dioxygenase (PhyH) family n=1 Tax=Pedobacter steynii TaxID=430522 RepID=A0A1G9Z2D0_9SPHI|nr:phytanoyl-CoA dioxygenase family protein [Pedobacter steynii]NQX39902.1 phytanoyl-CoA dioxygenase family protein [Pedobacter steynii]SDN14786.1 Ectoine hydroxylase-related dioxygenase, phytanoyl-CoA dioxygenase (PhyH) family [Pedobacter steynii]